MSLINLKSKFQVGDNVTSSASPTSSLVNLKSKFEVGDNVTSSVSVTDFNIAVTTFDPILNYGAGRSFNTTINQLPNVMNYLQIAHANSIQGGSVDQESVRDFRRDTFTYEGVDPIESGSITWDASNSMQNRIGIANPGRIYQFLPGGKPVDYTIPVSADAYNLLFPTIRTNDGNDPWKKLRYSDSIKLGFECLSNDDTSKYTALIFRALLSNGFTDNNSAALNSFRYFGRGEEFHTYQGFTREIGFSFKVAAFSRAELQPLYNKLNYLISQVYPDYSPNSGIMRAPVVKLTLGDYLYRVPGFLQSVNITVDNTTPWEINLENADDVQQLPHVVDVSISFKPIMNVLPQRSTDTVTNLIGNNSGSKSSFINKNIYPNNFISPNNYSY